MGGCCGSSKEEKHKDYSNIVVKNRWKIIKQLGKGGFGVVYEVRDINTDSIQTYAMKVEFTHKKTPTGRLPQEALVLETMAAKRLLYHVPEIFDKGRLGNNPNKPQQFIVLTLLGPDLNDLRKNSPQTRFSPSTCALIAIQGIDACQNLHKAGFVHRNIKPHNFMVGIKEHKHDVYMIDFGLAKKIFDEKGNLNPPRDTAPFRGTTRYCPTDSHRRIEFGRHHDLWCWLYSLIEMRSGQLPWANSDQQGIFHIKKKIIPSKWLNDYDDKPYLSLYYYLTSLNYTMEPPYDRYRQEFDNFLIRLQLDRNSPMYWEIGGEHYDKMKKNVIHKMFREEESSHKTTSQKSKKSHTDGSQKSHKVTATKVDENNFFIVLCKFYTIK